jgi:hypothetical protein
MLFIGANDRSTLLGVVEELTRERDTLSRSQKRVEQRLADPTLSKGKRALQTDQAANGAMIGVLNMFIGRFEMAAENGPTPDFSKLGEIRLTLTPEARRDLLRDQCQELATVRGLGTVRVYPAGFAFRYAVGAWSSEDLYADDVEALTACRAFIAALPLPDDAAVELPSPSPPLR